MLEVNAVGCWLGMKAVIDPMTKAGGGSIVNISSIEGFTGAEGLSAYSASKFAIRGMTKVAARELARPPGSRWYAVPGTCQPCGTCRPRPRTTGCCAACRR